MYCPDIISNKKKLNSNFILILKNKLKKKIEIHRISQESLKDK